MKLIDGAYYWIKRTPASDPEPAQYDAPEWWVIGRDWALMDWNGEAQEVIVLGEITPP